MIDQMSLFEFAAAVGGVYKANGGGKDQLNKDDAERLGALVRRGAHKG